MEHNFIYISTVIFAALYIIWTRDNFANRALSFAFLLMFLFGGFTSLKVSGILVV